MSAQASSYTWSTGTLIGLPALTLLVIAWIVCARLAFRWRARIKPEPYDERPLALGVAVACIVGAVVTVVGTAAGMWPYKAEYHQWRETSGVVKSVDSRFISAGQSATQRFVVLFTDGRQRACDDTRCSQLKPGDTLTLTCKREWQWAATPGWACNFVDLRGAR